MKGLEERLNIAAEKRNEKQHIEIHLSGLKSRLVQIESELIHCHVELDELEDILKEEERTTLSKLFNKVLGNREQIQERDRQNYLLTYLKCKACEDRIKEKQFEISVLENKLTGYVGIEDMYHKLLNEKKQQLKFRHKDLVNEIVLLETAIRHQSFQQKEIQEAKDIGLELEEQLVGLYEALVEISDISYFTSSDVRNGQVTYKVGFKKAREAKQLQQSVQIVSRLCDKFVEELDDVNERFELDYSPFTPRITTFLEYFYDGFISDWIRRKELKICLHHIDTTLAKVRRILGMLLDDDKKSKLLLRNHQDKLERLVLGKDIY